MGKRPLLTAAIIAFGTLSIVQAQFLSPTQTIFDGTGLRTPWAIATDPQGRHLYVASERGLAVLARDAQTGSISFIEAQRWGLGDLAGIRARRSVTVSPDGANVYAAGVGLAAFARDAASGRLEFLEAHITGPEGFVPLNASTSVLVSQDGLHVYVAAEDVVVVYERDPVSGALTFFESQPNRVGSIVTLSRAQSLASDAQGTHIYLSSEGDNALAAYSRDATTGLLTFLEEHRQGANGVQGLANPRAVTVSPEGNHVYVCSLGPIGSGPGAVAVFRRAANGTLSFVEAQLGGVNGSLDRASALKLSPDASHLYVTSEFAKLTVFSRNAEEGTLTLAESYQDGVNGVDGLSGASSVVLSPDGSHLYATGRFDNAVAVFRRDAASGSLDFSQALFDGDGPVSGAFQPTAVAVSPDGRHVYTASEVDNSLAVFQLDEHGMLTFVEACFEGSNGIQGLVGARSLALSPDGNHLYAAASDDLNGTPSALSAFVRDPATGKLDFLEAHFEAEDDSQGLAGARSVELSPDGNFLYVAASVDFGDTPGAVSAFQRDPLTGRLDFVEAHLQGVDGVDGLKRVRAIALSPDGAYLYAASGASFGDPGVIAIFQRESLTGRLTFQDAVADPAFERSGAPGLAVSPDGAHLYLASDGIATFRRDAASGLLTLVEYDRDGFVGVEGLQGARSITVHPYGTQVYAASPEQDALTVFNRDAVSGALSYVEGHFDGNPASPSGGGLEVGAKSTAVSPDGATLLVTGLDGDLKAFRITNLLVFPQFGDGQGLTSEIVLVNPNAETATGLLTFYDESGEVLTPDFPSAQTPAAAAGSPYAFSIPPLGSVRFKTGGQGELVQGSARVTSNRPIGGVIRFEIQGRGIAGVAAAPAGPSVTVPVQRAGSINPGIALQSPNSRPAVVSLILRDEQGEVVPEGRSTLDLAPTARVSRFIDELFPEADTEGFRGSLQIRQDGGLQGRGSSIAALALELGQPGEFTTLPVAPQANPLGDPVGFPFRLHFAQFGNGGGFSSELVLTAEAAGLQGEAAFFDEAGNPLDLRPHLVLPQSADDSAPVIGFSLQGRGSLRLATDGQGPLQLGSALVRCSGPFSGLVRFASDESGVAAVLGGRPLTRSIAPVQRASSGINTGIAVRNVNSESVEATLTLRNLSGIPVENGLRTLDIAPNARIAQFIDELFPQAQTDSFEGTVTVESSLPVAAIVLEQGPQLGQFTTLPVTPVTRPPP